MYVCMYVYLYIYVWTTALPTLLGRITSALFQAVHRERLGPLDWKAQRAIPNQLREDAHRSGDAEQDGVKVLLCQSHHREASPWIHQRRTYH